MKKKKHLFRRFLALILWATILFLLLNFDLVSYGISQLTGQLNIVIHARPIEEVTLDKSVSDSVKLKLQFIDAVKKFAIDSLGLKASKNYTTFYDQKRKPLLWVITASEPFEMKSYKWKFPLLGSVSYKGFFDYEKGLEEDSLLRIKGLDTDYGIVSAWSTLGWFRDPVLSNMLWRTKGQLAELIIHEMTHATLYLKSNVDLNENLASACGETGARRFLINKYGNESGELKEYTDKREDQETFSRQMLYGATLLDSVYKEYKDSLTILKLAAKNRTIKEIVRSFDTLTFHSVRYKNIFREDFPNNATFQNYIRYDSQKNEMKNKLDSVYGGDVRKFIDSFREE